MQRGAVAHRMREKARRTRLKARKTPAAGKVTRGGRAAYRTRLKALVTHWPPLDWKRKKAPDNPLAGRDSGEKGGRP